VDSESATGNVVGGIPFFSKVYPVDAGAECGGETFDSKNNSSSSF